MAVVVFFFFFFCTVEMPRGHRARWPCLAPGRTCRLLAIGMFESGPYGRDANVLSPGAIVFFFFFLLTWHWPRLAPAWTCGLLQIGMFNPGPYSRDKFVLPPGQKKKKCRTLLWQSDQTWLYFFFFFFCTFWMPRGRATVDVRPCLAPGQTCQLLPIGMLEPGPYGRHKFVLPAGQSGPKKKRI